MKRSWAWLAWGLAACASGRDGTRKEAPVATAVPAWLIVDESGAYGPHRSIHLSVTRDGAVHCTRVPVSGDPVSADWTLSAGEHQALSDALAADQPGKAHAAARPGHVADVGRSTLAVTLEDGTATTLVTDGDHAVEPPQLRTGEWVAAQVSRCVAGRQP